MAGNAVDILHGEIYAGFLCGGQNVQHRIG